MPAVLQNFESSEKVDRFVHRDVVCFQKAEEQQRQYQEKKSRKRMEKYGLETGLLKTHFFKTSRRILNSSKRERKKSSGRTFDPGRSIQV